MHIHIYTYTCACTYTRTKNKHAHVSGGCHAVPALHNVSGLCRGNPNTVAVEAGIEAVGVNQAPLQNLQEVPVLGRLRAQPKHFPETIPGFENINKTILIKLDQASTASTSILPTRSFSHMRSTMVSKPLPIPDGYLVSLRVRLNTYGSGRSQTKFYPKYKG